MREQELEPAHTPEGSLEEGSKRPDEARSGSWTRMAVQKSRTKAVEEGAQTGREAWWESEAMAGEGSVSLDEAEESQARGRWQPAPQEVEEPP